MMQFNLPRELLIFIPNFEYLLIDLSKYADENIRKNISPMVYSVEKLNGFLGTKPAHIFKIGP